MPDAKQNIFLRTVSGADPDGLIPLGALGKLLTPFIAALSRGDQGPPGPAGPQGGIGPAGPGGSVGPIGATGPRGATGPAGVTGPIGPTGATGPAGATGATGAQGAGVSLKGAVPTPADLPVSGQAGDTYSVTSSGSGYNSGDGYTWVGPGNGNGGPGSAWRNTGPLVGPIGATGPAGATGPVGATGAVGATGGQGVPGQDGGTGPAGPAGPVGPQGGQGPAGPAGPSGATGPAGPVGPAAPSYKTYTGPDVDYIIPSDANQVEIGILTDIRSYVLPYWDYYPTGVDIVIMDTQKTLTDTKFLFVVPFGSDTYILGTSNNQIILSHPDANVRLRKCSNSRAWMIC